jgi:hypothetical protein
VPLNKLKNLIWLIYCSEAQKKDVPPVYLLMDCLILILFNDDVLNAEVI